MEQPCPYLTLQTGKVETKTDTVPPQLSVTVIHRADTRAEFLPQSSAAGYQTDRSRLYLTNHNLLI